MRAAEEAAALRRRLQAVADPAYAEGAKAYLKSDLEFIGARMPDLRRIVRDWAKGRPGLTQQELVAMAKALWKEPVMDLRLAAAVLLERRADLLGPSDLRWLERLLRQAGTWALVDLLAPKVVGPVLARDPALRRKVLARWVKDEDVWVRRSALLAQLVELARGRGDWPLWVRLADGLAEDKEFWVRKAMGWMLRDQARRDPDRVVEFVGPRLGRLSGLTVREATRRLPAGHRRQLGLPAA